VPDATLSQAALVVTYLLCEMLNRNQFVVNFVLVALLQAVDFWFTKARTVPRAALFLPDRSCCRT
jgi:hypothetical protein